MNQFRTVIFDYPKLQVDTPEFKSVFSDIVTSKQINFQRTKDDFIAVDQNDMIGTHFLIYETSNMYHPKPVLAIRNCYEERVKKFGGLSLPYEGYIEYTGEEGIDAVEKLREKVGSLVNCDRWCVDPEYSYKNTGLALSELGFFMVSLHTIRMGYTHFMGCTNEKYKASRWIAKVGNLYQGETFYHPAVPDPHKLFIMDSFDGSWLKKCAEKYNDTIKGVWDLTPGELGYPSLNETLASIQKSSAPMQHPA